MKLSELLFRRLTLRRPRVGMRPRRILLLWLIVFAWWAAKEAGSWNDGSNIDTIYALVERQTWAVDQRPLPCQSFDRAMIRGRLYSVRPPVLALAGACIYAPLHFLGWSLLTVPAPPLSAYKLLTVLTSGLASAGIVTLFWMLLRQLGVGARMAAVAMVSLGAASMLSVYSTVFNHHTTAAGLVFVGWYLLAQARLTGELSRAGGLAAGAALGLAATIDPAGGGLFLVVLGSLGITSATVRRRMVPLAAGVLGAALLHVVLNYQITGDVVPALVRPSYYKYPGSSIPPEGLSGAVWPKSWASFLDYAGGVLFGWRGLVVFYPLAVPAVWATVELVRRRHPLWREFALVGVASLMHIVYVCVFTNNYAGACYGIRWFVLEVPFWYWVVWMALAKYLSRVEQVLVVGLAGYSGFMAWKGLQQGAWQTQPFPVEDSAIRYWMWGACAIVAVVMTACSVWRARQAVPGLTSEAA